MTKEEFLKNLEHNLKYLTPEAREEELNNYRNLNNYNDLNPINIANEIYQKRGIKVTISEKIKFLDAVNILIKYLQSKDKDKIKNILLFFLYMFFLVIIIKIPFIYVRDIITSIFNDIFKNDNIYTIWALTFEIIYAITSILIFIKMIKNKSQELEKQELEKDTK